MPVIFFLLFIVLPFVELALLLQIGSEIGAANTIGLILATGLLGGYLAKHEGLSVWSRFQQKLAQGGMPGDELLDGLIILVSGVLLVTPGVITDFLGLLGLLPPTRHFFKSQIKKRLFITAAGQVTSTFRASRQWAENRRDEPAEPAFPNANPSPTSSSGRVDITEIVDRQSHERSV